MVCASLLLTLAAEPAPLIDIDKTVFIQLAVFLVMWVVLSQFVFGPYLKMRAKRTVAIDGARAEAVAMQVDAKKIVADYDAGLVQTRARGNQERARLAAEGIKEEQRLLGQARTESNVALTQARTLITTQTEAASKTLQSDANGLAREMAQKILGRQVQS